MEERFDNLQTLVFSNIWCHYWIFQLGQQMQQDRIQEIAKYFNETLIYNKCRIEDLQREWTVLKTIVKPIYENDTKAKYLDI